MSCPLKRLSDAASTAPCAVAVVGAAAAGAGGAGAGIGGAGAARRMTLSESTGSSGRGTGTPGGADAGAATGAVSDVAAGLAGLAGWGAGRFCLRSRPLRVHSLRNCVRRRAVCGVVPNPTKTGYPA